MASRKAKLKMAALVAHVSWEERIEFKTGHVPLYRLVTSLSLHAAKAVRPYSDGPEFHWEAELDENHWLKPEYLHKMIDLLDDTLWEGFVAPQIEAMMLDNPDWFWTEEEADARWAKKESDDDA